MLTTALIEKILAAIPTRTVGLVGDLFLDRYLEIDPELDELSLETGLTAYQVTHVRSQPGALGTVINNLVALGVGRVVPVAIIGDDGEGYELQQTLRRMPGLTLDGLLIAGDRRTPTYTKPMRRKEELNRLDIKNRTPTPERYEVQILELLETLWSNFDAVLVLDQVSEPNRGVITHRVREKLSALALEDPDKFILADSREQIGFFRQLSIKPNVNECVAAVMAKSKVPITDTDRSRAPIEMSERVQGAVFCTNSERGITYVPKPQSGQTPACIEIPGYPVCGPIDVVGAGDSCSAGIACGIVSGASAEQAAAFGNLVASITVQQLGTTGTASPQQVRDRWREVMSG